MVLFFEPRGCRPGGEDWLIYMGRDKFENEDLIRYGLPNDIWFHVDDLSSAHVYLRLPEGADMDSIPAETLEDCCQLVKQNSIQGCKLNNVSIVYTPWANLRKTASMEVGQVSFHDRKAVRKTRVEKRNNDIVNRLNRTKREENPDLAARRDAHDQPKDPQEVRRQRKAEAQEARAAEKAAREQTRHGEELRSYSSLMQAENMKSNAAMTEDYEDDFM